MPFGLVQNSMQLAEFVVLLTLTPLGAAVTGLRLFATYRNSRKPGLEDWMALFATVFFILSEFAALIAINILNGQDSVVQAVESPDDFKLRRKWDLVSIYGYIGHTTFVKLSVLALYHRIFGVRCIFRNWIVVLGACQFVIFSLGCVLQPLQCRPFARFLDISVPGACTSPGPYLLLLEMPNSLVDFAMVSLAIIMIRSLQLPRSTKLKLQFLFGLGVLVGIMGFVKIALNYAKPTFDSGNLFGILACVQNFVSLLCCCLPVLNPIMPAASFWKQLYSRVAAHAASKIPTRQKWKMPKKGGIFSTGSEPSFSSSG